MQRGNLLPHHVRSEVAVGPALIALVAQLLGHIEHDCHSERVIFTRQLHQAFAVFLPHVGSVHHGQPAFPQALARDVVERVERVRRGRLVVLVVRDQSAKIV